MASAPLRVMLVDDHALVRSAVRQALIAPDIDVVAEASTAQETLEMAPQLHPDVLLMDINLPGADGLSLLRELVPRLPDTKIVMLTISEDRRDLLQAMRNGAAGYLTKDLGPDALQRAIRGLRKGDLAMSRAMAAIVVRELSVGGRQIATCPSRGHATEFRRLGRPGFPRGVNLAARDPVSQLSCPHGVNLAARSAFRTELQELVRVPRGSLAEAGRSFRAVLDRELVQHRSHVGLHRAR